MSVASAKYHSQRHGHRRGDRSPKQRGSSVRAALARLPQQKRERADASQESGELTEEDDRANQKAYGEKPPH